MSKIENVSLFDYQLEPYKEKWTVKEINGELACVEVMARPNIEVRDHHITVSGESIPNRLIFSYVYQAYSIANEMSTEQIPFKGLIIPIGSRKHKHD